MAGAYSLFMWWPLLQQPTTGFCSETCDNCNPLKKTHKVTSRLTTKRVTALNPKKYEEPHQVDNFNLNGQFSPQANQLSYAQFAPTIVNDMDSSFHVYMYLYSGSNFNYMMVDNSIIFAFSFLYSNFINVLMHFIIVGSPDKLRPCSLLL